MVFHLERNLKSGSYGEVANFYRPANDLLEALRESLGAVVGLLKEHDGTSIRRGAINKLLMDCYNVKLPMLVMRSGHDLTRVCAVFEYEWMALLFSSIAGKSLGDWTTPRRLLPSIKLAAVEKHILKTEGEIGINRLLNLIGAVFHLSSQNKLLHHGERLFNFVKCFFATLLLHLFIIQENFGTSHFLFIHVRDKLHACNLYIE